MTSGPIRTRTRGTATSGKSRARKATPLSPLQQYQERAARAFSIPRLDLDTSLIIECALTTGEPPAQIAAHLGLPVSAVEDVLLSSILSLGRVLDIAAADATVSR